MEATEMSINRWMHKEAAVHICNGILLRHQKGHIWASADEVDEPRAYLLYRVKQARKRKKKSLFIFRF